MELLGPFLGLETRRRIAWNQEKRTHRMQIAERRLWLSHLQGSDAQGPQIWTIVVCGIRILIASNDLWCHPIGSTCSRETFSIEYDSHSRYPIHSLFSFSLSSYSPINVLRRPIVRSSCAETPKSTSFTSALSVSSTFWPLMSRWMTLLQCK